MKQIIVLLLVLGFTSFHSNAQSPAKYICDKFGGELSQLSEERSFVGETYKCSIEDQWDMMIMSEINDMVLNDENFGSARDWNKTYVDSENYSRRSFSFNADEYFIVNLYVPFEKKSNHFYISE